MSTRKLAQHAASAHSLAAESVELSDLELFLVEVPCRSPLPPVRGLLVRLATDEGHEGWGETRTTWRPAELAARREVLLPTLAGRSVFDIEELLRLDTLSDASLRAAIEMASWDLVGRLADQPLYHLWGGLYRQKIPLAVRLPDAPDRLPQMARELAEQGFHTQIVATSGQVAHDRELVSAVKAVGGERAELRFDARHHYELEAAVELCRDLEKQSLAIVLDPLREPDPSTITSLARQTNVPLGHTLDGSGMAGALNWSRSGAIRHLVLEIERVGGLWPARQCAIIAEAAGMSLSIAAAPALGISVAAMLHLAAATPALASANECAYHELQDDVLTTPLDVVNGMMTVPSGPGLGVTVDRGKLERFLLT